MTGRRRMGNGIIWAIAVLCVAGLLIGYGCSSETHEYSTNSSPAMEQTVQANSTAAPKNSPKTGIDKLDAAVERARAENKPIYLEFSATWCGPCQSFKRTVLHDAEVKEMLDNKVVFVAADVDRDKALSRQYNVSSVPTGYLLKVEDGMMKTVDKHVGGMSKSSFMTFLNQAIQ